MKGLADQQRELSLKRIEDALHAGELSKVQYETLRGRCEGINAMVGEKRSGGSEFEDGTNRFFNADNAVREGKMSVQEADAFKNGYTEGIAYIVRRSGIMPPPGKDDKYGIGDPTTFRDDKKYLIVKEAVRNIIEVKLHPH